MSQESPCPHSRTIWNITFTRGRCKDCGVTLPIEQPAASQAETITTTAGTAAGTTCEGMRTIETQSAAASVQTPLPVSDFRLLSEHIKYRLYATAFQRGTVPPGWKLVPEVPTDAMLDALGNSPWIVESDTKVVGNQVITTRREHREQRYVVDGWQNMLAAAPEAPK
jgi:hypothetical protein